MTEEDNELEIRHTDFNQAFEELYSCSHQLTIPGLDFNACKIFKVKEVGKLLLSSGQLIAWEPYKEELSSRRLKYETLNIKINPGLYPVILSLFYKYQKPEIACAMLRLQNQPAIRWELAKCVDNSIFSYKAIDASSFMDIDVAKYLCSSHNYEERKCLELYEKLYKLYDCYPNDKNEFIHNSIRDMYAQMKENKEREGFAWANVRVRKDTEANIISFSSGAGNACASYIGYDIRGNIVNIIIDFFVMLNFYIEDEEDLLKKL